MGHGHRYRTHDEIVRGGLWQMTTHPAIQAGPVHDRMRRMGSERHWLGLGRGPLRRFGMEAIWILEHAGMEPGLLGVGHDQCVVARCLESELRAAGAQISLQNCVF